MSTPGSGSATQPRSSRRKAFRAEGRASAARKRSFATACTGRPSSAARFFSRRRRSSSRASVVRFTHLDGCGQHLHVEPASRQPRERAQHAAATARARRSSTTVSARNQPTRDSSKQTRASFDQTRDGSKQTSDGVEAVMRQLEADGRWVAPTARRPADDRATAFGRRQTVVTQASIGFDLSGDSRSADGRRLRTVSEQHHARNRRPRATPPRSRAPPSPPRRPARR